MKWWNLFSDHLSDPHFLSMFSAPLWQLKLELLFWHFHIHGFLLVLKKQPACHVSLDVNCHLFPELVKRRQSGWMRCVRLLRNFIRGGHRLRLEKNVRFPRSCRNLRSASRWMAYRNAWIAVPVLASWRGSITVEHVDWLVRGMKCITNSSNIVRYTGCPRRNVPHFGRVFLMLKYTDITQNTYVQSWMVMEIMAREKCGFLAGPRTVTVSWQPYLCYGVECGVIWRQISSRWP